MRILQYGASCKQSSSALKMSGSAAVAQRRHIGLQQLQAISASTRSFLGPNKRRKFVRDESSGDAELVSSCARLLERMELDGSVAQLLHETVQAQQKVFHSGTGALTFLSGVWSGVALECLNRGMSVSDIKAAMSRGLELSLEVCEQSAVSVQDVSCKRKPSQDIKAHNLKHSRHFNAQTQNTSPALNDVTGVAEAVSHGCDASMRLVLKACELQHAHGSFDIQKLVTCRIPGRSEERSRVLHGYVTLLSSQQASLLPRLQGQEVNIALVNGDLSETYRHAGFNTPASVTRVTDRVSVEECWIEKALKTLQEFGVGVVLVSGAVDVALKERCSIALMVEGVRSSVLKEFSARTGAVPLAYITQLDGRSVGRGVTVSRCDENEFVSIAIACSSLVTAVLTSSVPAKLQILEDEFWSCAHRLRQALADGMLLRGAGVTELLCVRRLREPTESPLERVVLELMADAWVEYASALMLNGGAAAETAEAWTAVARLCEDGGHACLGLGGGVYDNVTGKAEAWRRALDLVFLVLQSDTEIITGVREEGSVYHQLMFL